MITVGSNKAYVCILWRWRHLHLLNIWPGCSDCTNQISDCSECLLDAFTIVFERKLLSNVKTNSGAFDMLVLFKRRRKETRTEEEEGGPMCVSAGGGARTQRVHIALVNNGEEDYQFVLSSQ